MRAAVANRLGGPEVLEEATLADPMPGPGEVLIDLRAASVNRRDRGVRLGTIRPQDRGEGEGSVAPFPYVLGSDGAGVVVERGPGVQSPLEGAEVVINPALFWGDSELRAGRHLAGPRRAPAGDVRRAHRRPGRLRAAKACAPGLAARGGAPAGRADRLASTDDPRAGGARRARAGARLRLWRRDLPDPVRTRPGCRGRGQLVLARQAGACSGARRQLRRPVHRSRLDAAGRRGGRHRRLRGRAHLAEPQRAAAARRAPGQLRAHRRR